MQSQKCLKLHTWYYGKEIAIPSQWLLEPLGWISKDVYRYPTYFGIEYTDQGIPEIRGELLKGDGTLELNERAYRHISQETSNKFPRTIVKEGDIILSVRGTMGKLALVPKEKEGANITANLVRISPDRKKVHPSYLRSYLLSRLFKDRLNALSPQTTIKTIESGELKSIKVILPQLPEQEKIASILSKVDNLIQKTDESIEQTQRLKKGLMQRLLFKGIRHEEFKLLTLGPRYLTEEIPKDWQTVRLDSMVSQSISYGVLIPDEDRNGIPMIRSGEIDVPGGIDRNLTRISKSLEERYRRTRLEGGEILMALVGATIGRLTIAPKSSRGYNVSRHLAVIRLKNEFLPEYYAYLLRATSVQQMIRVMTTGSAQPVVNLAELSKFILPVPTKAEQQEIASIISHVVSAISGFLNYKNGLMCLKKGLMQKLLTGQVRVKV